VLLGELAETAEIRTRALRIARRRWHRHEPADVGIDLEQPGQLLGRHARLRVLAREVDFGERRNRELACCGLRGERVAELAELAHQRRLPALQMADEVPAERVAVDAVLRL
jgi:hypothetical protein